MGLGLKLGVLFAPLAVFLGATQASAQVASSGPASPQQGGGGVTPTIIPIGGGSTAPAPIGPEHFAPNPGGVDMRSGLYKHSRTDLPSLEGEGKGLFLERTLNGDGGHVQPFGLLFSHNWVVRIDQQRVQVQEANTIDEYDYQVAVAYSGLGTSFRALYNTGSLFREISPNARGLLIYTGNRNTSAVYTFTAKDGTQVVFRPLGTNCFFSGPVYAKCAYASQIVQPSGDTYTFEYDTSPAGASEQSRLRAVTSNRGFALLFEYYAPSGGYNLVSKACLINLAVAPKPTNNVCPSGAVAASYTYSGIHLASATDPTGATEQIASSTASIAITRPGMTSPYVTNTLAWTSQGEPYVTAQNFADGATYSYVWDPAPAEDGATAIAGGRYTNPAGNQVIVRYGQYVTPNSNDPTLFLTPGPESVTDELGRVTTSNYCTPHSVTGECQVTPLRSRTSPEGNRIEMDYDAYRNVIQTRRVPKPGSGLSTEIESKTFNCSSAILCDKPTSETDARGGVTDYVYDPVHGQITRKTLPANPAGIRAQTRYAYVQRYAWIKNTTGGYQQAASPVWLLASEESCLTSAADASGNCAAGAADEVVTSYDYGPNSGPNNLLLRGIAVTAGGVTQRTCYGYDALGRRISETSANANLAVCP